MIQKNVLSVAEQENAHNIAMDFLILFGCVALVA